MPKNKNKDDTDYIKHWFDDSFHRPSRTVYMGDVYGGIEDGLCADVFKAIHQMECDGGEHINIYLNSYGGDCSNSFAIYERLKSSPCPVIIDVYGACMSGGSIIFQAGDVRRISKMSVFMIHDGEDYYCGQQRSFEAWGEWSKKHYRKYMYSVYYQNMRKVNKNITIKEIEQLCSKDSIFTAKQAVKLGLADEVI